MIKAWSKSTSIWNFERLFDDGCYLSAFDSVADDVQEITEETAEIPDHLRYDLDYASMRETCS